MKNYLSEMLNALTSAYSQRDYANRARGFPLETNIGKLFSIFAWGLESVHEQAELIKLWDDIDYAKGAVLDRYGANFGVKRNGASDIFYRLLIKVKLLSQLSGGDINTVIYAAASLFNTPPENVTLTEEFPAKIEVEVAVQASELSPDNPTTAADISFMLKRILSAGIRLDFVVMVEESISINADFRPSAFIITHVLTGTKPQIAVVVRDDGIIVDENLSKQVFTAKHEQTRETLHSGTNPVRILHLELDGLTLNEQQSITAFTETFDLTGTKPQIAVVVEDSGITITEKGKPAVYTTEYEQTRETLHTGAKAQVIAPVGIQDIEIDGTVKAKIYQVEVERAGTEPQPSVLGDTDAAGITTGITPASYSVRYRKCGRGATKS